MFWAGAASLGASKKGLREVGLAGGVRGTGSNRLVHCCSSLFSVLWEAHRSEKEVGLRSFLHFAFKMKVLCRQKSSFGDGFNHFQFSRVQLFATPLIILVIHSFLALKKPGGGDTCHSENFEEELGTLTG